MAEVKTILVTSQEVEGPYRINEEDFDEKIHKHVSAAKEAAVEKAAEASIAKAEKADSKK
jgi:hypothetical protein